MRAGGDALGDVLEVAERMWQGEIAPPTITSVSNDLTEVADDTGFVWSMANVTAFGTGDGLVLVDTGSEFMGGNIQQAVRSWTSEPVHSAVYSHGHIDHVFGILKFEAEGRPASVIAHENVAPRFDRYVMTADYNSLVNIRQFSLPGIRWPTTYRYPDETYRDELTVTVGDEIFELHHAKGETDDATWTWVPARKATRRRSSGIRSSGPERRDTWPRSAPKCCCLVTACPSWAPAASGRPSPTSRSSSSTSTMKRSR
jgi:hypothetical protein